MVRIIIFLLTLLVLSFPAFAGEFVRDGERTKVNLSVSFSYDETDPDSFKPLFEEANKLLWDATDGQVQLGQIDVYVDSNTDTSDVLISSSTGGAKANPAGIDNSNGHIYLTQTHKSQDESVANARGYFGLMHELGHYAFNLGDEYRVNVYESENGKLLEEYKTKPYAYCVEEDSAIGCIMDGGTTVHPNHHRTEFCVASNHRSDGINSDGHHWKMHQEVMNPGESCWQTIVSFLNNHGITIHAPSNEPSNTAPTGIQEIVWRVHGRVSQVLCLDSSGSMRSSSRMDLAKQGANLYVNMLNKKDNLAVTGYASSGYTRYPLTSLTQDNESLVKQQATNAINSLYASGMTAMGYGLNVSLSQILSASDPAGKEAIILLSDGYHNSGQHPSAYYSQLKARGVKVYTVGLGAGADSSLMSSISTQTGGKYYFAQNSWQLPSIFSSIHGIIHDSNLFEWTANTLGGNATVLKKVIVDSFSKAVDFIVSWEGSTPPEVELISPDGTLITESNLPENISILKSGSYQTYSVENPLIGDWQIQITNKSPSNLAYELSVPTDDQGVVFTCQANKNTVVYPEPIHIEASVIANMPVDGAEVHGFVTRPDGSEASVVLYDDGSTEHGDRFAYDGIYSNYFTGYIGNGAYLFRVDAVNEVGVEAYRSPGLGEDGDNPIVPVPPFKRTADFTVLVNNVPTIHNGTTQGSGYMLLDNDRSHRAYFSFNAQALNGLNSGRVTFRHYSPTFGKVYVDSESLSLVEFSPDGKTANAQGFCKLNGVSGYQFKLQVADNGTPGASVDSFKIEIWDAQGSQNITLGEFLTGGDIDVATN